MDRYTILSNLGSGTFGEVYKARHIQTGTVVAIKRLRLRCPSFADALELAEVSSLRRLQQQSSSSSGGNDSYAHRNIVQILECIRESSGALQLVFEYMADGNLYDLIRRASAERAAIQQQRQQRQQNGVGGAAAGSDQQQQQILTHPRIQSIISQVLSGLAFMNSRSYFHRDLKPENILISGPTAKIADLGLAKTHTAAKFTSYVSTRWYRGPELLLRSPRYTQTIDSFAVGCIVAELYNLAPLFPGANELDQLWKEMSVIGAPTDGTWPEGVRLAERLGVSMPTIVPYERRREYRLEQRRVQQQLAAAAEQQRHQLQLQQQQQGGGDEAAAAAAVAAAAMHSPMMMANNAILQVPLEKIMTTAPASAQRLTAALLVLNPAKRLDAAAALRHEYFAPPRTTAASYSSHDHTATTSNGHRSAAPPPRRAKDDRIVDKNSGLTVGMSMVKKRGRTVGGDQSISAAAKGHAGVGEGGGAAIIAGGRSQPSQQENYYGQPPATTAATNMRGKGLAGHSDAALQDCQGEHSSDDIGQINPQKKRRQQHQQLKDVSTSTNNITPMEASNNSLHSSKGGGFHEWLLAGTHKRKAEQVPGRK